MSLVTRRLAVALAGYCAFLNLYSPQALLPVLAREFNASAGRISAVMTASSFAIALTAPFTGAVADVLGRKRVIACALLALTVPMAMVATAASVDDLVFWRFVQGLLLPPIFAVTVAYIGDEWPSREIASVAGLYVSGSSLGGFSGRLIPGVLTDLVGWRHALASLAVLTLAGGIAFALLLEPERRFVRSEGLLASLRQMARNLRDPRLLAFYAVGFGVLFNFLAVFTYVNFHLAAPPYRLTPSMLGACYHPARRTRGGTAGTPQFCAGRDRGMGRGRAPAARLPPRRHPHRPDLVRDVRNDLPSRFDKRGDGDRASRTLLRGRALRHLILCGRQRGCLSPWPDLATVRLAFCSRHGACDAGADGADRRAGLGKRRSTGLRRLG